MIAVCQFFQQGLIFVEHTISPWSHDGVLKFEEKNCLEIVGQADCSLRNYRLMAEKDESK